MHFVLEGHTKILCSPDTDIIPVHFTVDVGSRLITKNERCGQVVLNPDYDLAAEVVPYGQIFRFLSLDELKFVRFPK